MRIKNNLEYYFSPGSIDKAGGKQVQPYGGAFGSNFEMVITLLGTDAYGY